MLGIKNGDRYHPKRHGTTPVITPLTISTYKPISDHFCDGVGRNGETPDLAIGRLRLVRHILEDDRQLFFIAETLSNHI
jgi:hypothetical protein